MAGLFVLSAQSDLSPPTGVDDKTAHFLAYFVLGVLFVRALAGGLSKRVGPRAAALGVLLTVAYGATDEWHQTFVAGRDASFDDLVVDAAGAAAAAALCWAWGMIAVRSDR